MGTVVGTVERKSAKRKAQSDGALKPGARPKGYLGEALKRFLVLGSWFLVLGSWFLVLCAFAPLRLLSPLLV